MVKSKSKSYHAVQKAAKQRKQRRSFAHVHGLSQNGGSPKNHGKNGKHGNPLDKEKGEFSKNGGSSPKTQQGKSMNIDFGDVNMAMQSGLFDSESSGGHSGSDSVPESDDEREVDDSDDDGNDDGPSDIKTVILNNIALTKPSTGSTTNPIKQKLNLLASDFNSLTTTQAWLSCMAPMIIPTSKDRSAMEDAFELLQTLVVAHMGITFYLKAQGSYAQGLTLPYSSDLDLVLCHTDETIVTRKIQVKWLANVVKILRQENADGAFVISETIFQATIPIVKIKYYGERNSAARADACFEIDLSAGDVRRGICDEVIDQVLSDQSGLVNTKIVLDDSFSRIFCRLVKAFANTYNLNDTRNRGLSNFSWVLLAIFYLQEKGMLRTYNVISTSSSSKNSNGGLPKNASNIGNSNGGNGGIQMNLNSASQTVAGLFIEFLDWLAFHPTITKKRICISTGKATFAQITTLLRGSYDRAPLQVQVPLAEDGDNAARCLSSHIWESKIAPMLQRSARTCLREKTWWKSVFEKILKQSLLMKQEEAETQAENRKEAIPSNISSATTKTISASLNSAGRNPHKVVTMETLSDNDRILSPDVPNSTRMDDRDNDSNAEEEGMLAKGNRERSGIFWKGLDVEDESEVNEEIIVQTKPKKSNKKDFTRDILEADPRLLSMRNLLTTPAQQKANALIAEKKLKKKRRKRQNKVKKKQK